MLTVHRVLQVLRDLPVVKELEVCPVQQDFLELQVRQEHWVPLAPQVQLEGLVNPEAQDHLEVQGQVANLVLLDFQGPLELLDQKE